MFQFHDFGIFRRNNTVTFNALSEGTYADCTLTVTDAVGYASTLSVSSFTVDTSAPTVSTISPADAATAVSAGTTIAITFSEAMNTTTLTSNMSNTSCSETLQVSSDNFSTCVPMASAPSTFNSNKTFTIAP